MCRVVQEGGAPGSVVNATAPSPGVRLRITDTAGRDVAGTRLGEKLQLRVELDQSGLFGMFARSLVAVSGAGGDSIQLLDERGCPVDSVIFPGLAPDNTTQDLVGSFQAFRFSESSVVRFQVTVGFCVGDCPAAACQDGLVGAGRRRRRSGDHQPGQQVELVREILVEPPAEEAGRAAAAPRAVLLETERVEEVCTSWPVITATAAGILFLQLCTLAACLLCLYTDRRQVGSAAPLLHSSSLSYRARSLPSTATRHTFRSVLGD